jgi:hypothetical protein
MERKTGLCCYNHLHTSWQRDARFRSLDYYEQRSCNQRASGSKFLSKLSFLILSFSFTSSLFPLFLRFLFSFQVIYFTSSSFLVYILSTSACFFYLSLFLFPSFVCVISLITSKRLFHSPDMRILSTSKLVFNIFLMLLIILLLFVINTF